MIEQQNRSDQEAAVLMVHNAENVSSQLTSATMRHSTVMGLLRDMTTRYLEAEKHIQSISETTVTLKAGSSSVNLQIKHLKQQEIENQQSYDKQGGNSLQRSTWWSWIYQKS